MGRNPNGEMAIIRAGGLTTAMTEGSCKFCSILENISVLREYKQYTYIKLYKNNKYLQ